MTFDQLSERLNPIIVKEIRQGLRTRVFWVCFSVLLLACFVLSVGAWAGSLRADLSESGPAFFFGFFICLGAVQFFIIPYTAYRSLAREREEETWVLLSLTGIGARRVLRGKVGSYLVQAALYGSAVLPFLLFSYYLNGIDLPTIVGVTALGGAWMLFLTCAAVCAAAIGTTRIVRGLMHFTVLGALLGATAFAWTVAAALVFEADRLSPDEIYPAVGVCLWLMLTYGMLLFQAAAAQLALPTEDTAKGPRLVLLFQCFGSAGILAWSWDVMGRPAGLVVIGLLLMLAHLLAVGWLLVSAPRFVHEVHQRRRFLPLLRPGPASAFRLMICLITSSTAGAVALYSVSKEGDSVPSVDFLLALGAHALFYLALPVVLGRVLPVLPLATPVGQRLLGPALLGVGTAVPPFLAALLERRLDDPALNLFNPIIGLMSWIDAPYRSGIRWESGTMGIVAVAALGLVIAADRVLTAAERSKPA